MNDEELTKALESLSEVRALLGDKFSFADLIFFVDKNNIPSSEQFKKLKEMGWEPNDYNSFVYRG